jgi:hypothetical protein
MQIREGVRESGHELELACTGGDVERGMELLSLADREGGDRRLWRVRRTPGRGPDGRMKRSLPTNAFRGWGVRRAVGDLGRSGCQPAFNWPGSI